MRDVIRAAPARLEAYSAATTPTIGPARDAVDVYAEAVRGYNAAGPNDLGHSLDDRSGPLLEVLDRLRTLDELPGAFAAALRQIDAAFEPGRGGGPGVLSMDDRDRFNRLVAEQLVLGRLGSDGEDGALDDIRDVAEWLQQQVGRISKLGDWFEHFPDAARFVFEEVTTTLRRTVIVVEELTADGWRRAVQTMDELAVFVRRYTVDIDLRALQRAAPFLKKLGLVGDVFAGGFAAWEQWDSDADRPDLSPTERALRAGVDGTTRGLAQVVIGVATTAIAAPLVAATPVTGGLSLVAAGAVIAGGVWLGEKIDPPLADALDRFYDSDFGRGLISGAADGIDAAGRGIRDVALGARDLAERGWDAGNQRLDEFQEWSGEQLDAAGERAEELREDLGDSVDRVGERVGELRDDLGDGIDHLGDQVGELRDDVEDRVDHLGDQVGELRDDVEDRVDHLGDQVGDGLETISAGAEGASDWVEDRWPF